MAEAVYLGEGRLFTICDTDSPPAYPVVVHMNFRSEGVKKVLATLNWATADPDHDPRMWCAVARNTWLTNQLQSCLPLTYRQAKYVLSATSRG